MEIKHIRIRNYQSVLSEQFTKYPVQIIIYMIMINSKTFLSCFL